MAPKALRVTLGSGWALLLSFVVTVAWIGGIPQEPRLFQIAYAVGFLGYVLIVRSVLRAPDEASLGAWRWWFFGAIVLRVLPLTALPSDDIYRYIWEGRVQQAGHSPYRLAPDDPSLESLRWDDWDKINHPSFPAIYPPLAQLEFRALAVIQAAAFGTKLVQVVWDVATLALLAIALRRRGFRPHLAVVYGLCPLVLAAFAVEGHNDSLMLMLTVAAMVALTCQRPMLAGAALGSAIAAKTIAIVLIPWFLLRQRRAAFVALVVTLLWYVPFGTDGFAGLANLRRFGELSEFFSFLGSLWVLDLDTNPGRTTAVIVLGVAVAVFAVRCRRVEPFAALAFAAVVLTLPVVHYWYLTWVLVFVPFAFRWSWPVAAGAMVLYFQAAVIAEHLGEWIMPAWVSVVVWLIFLTAWVLGRLRPPVTHETASDTSRSPSPAIRAYPNNGAPGSREDMDRHCKSD